MVLYILNNVLTALGKVLLIVGWKLSLKLVGITGLLMT